MTEFGVFAERRQKLAKRLAPNSVVLVVAASEQFRNADVEQPYRQDSSFFYLTGFNEPDAWLLILTGPEPQSMLFNHARDPSVEVWTGPRVGQQGAVEAYGFDESFVIAELDDRMPDFLQGRNKIYFSFADEQRIMPKLTVWGRQLRHKVRSGVKFPYEYVDLQRDLYEMRLFKSSHEIDLLRYAAKATTAAHQRAMQMAKPGQYEYQLEAEILHEFMQHGCRFPAYGSIVAGGANSCILHYTANDQALHAGDLLLIDAGAEYQYYASDVTRTFPVSGTFSDEQRLIYELVLAAQMEVIEMIKPGVAWNALQQTAVRVITTGLVELGLLQGSVTELIEEKAYMPFYMHGVGHWLGMDVHDVGHYKIDEEWRELKAHMVFTVEPGIYIAPDAEVDARWRGIGVRIEDDVVVTSSSCQVLTEDLPKTADDIESLMAERARQ